MKKKQLLFLLILIFIISISLTYSFFYIYKIQEVNTIDVTVEFKNSDSISFITDTDALRFGKISLQGVATREINLANNKDYDMLVKIKDYGETKEWLTYSNNDFLLKPKQNKNISFTIFAPNEEQYIGNHTGKVKIFFLRP